MTSGSRGKGLFIVASRFALFGIVSLVLVALSGAVLADAQPASPGVGSRPHLLLVPAHAEPELTLARADVRVIARYESFTLVEAAGADEQRLLAAGAQRRDDMRAVGTAAGSIDPAARPSLAGKQAPDRDEVLALVQFVGPPKDVWLDRLRATGARLVTYQAENAYVVHAAGAAAERLGGLVGRDPSVRAVTPVTARDKVEAKVDPTARYAVASVAGAIGEAARDRAADAGPVVRPRARVGSLVVQYLRLSPAEVDRLARDPAVVVIERKGTPRLHDERSAQILAGNLGAPTLTQPSGPGYLAWHDARFPGAISFAIDVTDSGLDDGSLGPAHTDFSGRVEYQSDYTLEGAQDCAGHGTNVASIAAGLNSGAGAGVEDAQGFNYGLGVAPGVGIGASKIFDCNGEPAAVDLADLTDSAYADGAVISNNSWGTNGAAFWGTYSTEAALYDQLVRDARPGVGGNQEMVEVFSAGNDGDIGGATINAEGTAKNVITVGASESVRATGLANGDGCVFDSGADNARELIGFSSRGPTDDGRMKPDVVAPGTHVAGARPQHPGYTGSGTCTPFFVGAYSLVSGTSQAAPHVSGAAALVRRWYEDNEATTPSPALTKALLVNTATDLAAGPDVDQGWGRVNLGSAFDATSREFHDQRPVDVLSTVGDTAVSAFTVADASKPVKVTLAWTDAPGPPAGPAWVNNLDLEVAGGGRNYLGNSFDGAYSRTGGVADTRNNVESVYLPAGTSGRLSVTVRGTALGGDGLPGNADGTDQDFALVVSNATETTPAPVLAHESAAVTGGDGDAALESDETAQLTEVVRNAGNDDAVTPSASLTGGPGLSVTQAASGYPSIADDGTASNTTPFSVHLANAATCGADATAALSVTAASETQTIPIVLPTGAPGAQQTNSAGSSALSIPDNSAAGVSSSIFVGERGRIKDVDVAIPAIAHTWVGDLVIDLTGPDGTRVRLADHPGGPDNGADNMTGTFFNDEAAANIAAGPAPYSGAFKPQNDQLSRFDGKNRRGTWTLTVRDTFTDDTGTLQGWSLQTQKALCNVDVTPPDTAIGGGPGSTTTSTSAQFSLGSNDGGATFECRLDGAAYAPCDATVQFGGLALGSHTFSARAIDGSDNEDPAPAAYTWTVATGPGPPPPPPPPTPAATSFVLAPAEERLADVLAGRYRVLAACGSACRASAKVTVSARTARQLKLGNRSASLGSASRSRRSAGLVVASVRLSKRARAALRGRALTKAVLRVTLTEGASRLTLKRTVELRRASGPRRIAERGLRLWTVAARRSSVSGKLTVSAREARRLGLKPGRAKRIELASGRTTATRTPGVLTVRVRRSARRDFARARRVAALLEAVAGTRPEPTRAAKLSKTLRR